MDIPRTEEATTISLSFFSSQIGLCDTEVAIYFNNKAIVSVVWGTGEEGICKVALGGISLMLAAKEIF